MRSALAAAAQRRAGRNRSASLATVAPSENDQDYVPELATIAASILYRSPLVSQAGRPIYILNSAAFPDVFDADYDSLLSYVLARLPAEEELISGNGYEIVFFAGGQPDNASSDKKQGPSTGWYLQAYHALSRALRKKLQMLYIVHPRTWVRVLLSIFGTIVSPKFRRKIAHVNSLSSLALQIPIEKLLIPPSAYIQDRKISPDVYAPYVTGKRAFGVRHPFPKNIVTAESRLPRMLRETTSFILMPANVRVEGLFRIPPHSVLAGILKEAYDRSQQFIIWKENGATVVQPGIEQSLVDEVRLEDAYGVHLAASMIKMWYRELREPIFPELSYAALREKFEDPNTPVALEDLQEMFQRESQTSTLSPISREIVTRHLLPLLFSVVSHEAENKMGAENLAICFSMCLLCGSNQLEDGKMSMVIKRILQSAIEMWPQLRTNLGIDPKSFAADLLPPADLRDYEDPLEDERPTRMSHEDNGENRITMNDSESPNSEQPEQAPPLPPRRRRAVSKAAATKASAVIEALPFSKRKPPPPLDTEQDSSKEPTVMAEPMILTDLASSRDPPRYSTVFDPDGHSIHVADSPISYTPADGFGPPRRANISFDENVKEKSSSHPPPAVPSAMLDVPKRKALSGSSKIDDTSAERVRGQSAERSGELEQLATESNALLARMAAQQAANQMTKRMNGDGAASNSETNSKHSSPTEPTSTKPSESASRPDDSVFRKPSWPASAYPTGKPRQQPNLHSLARPAIPAQSPPTTPTIAQNGSVLSIPAMPKPRAPSPGLLRRMSSMESSNQTGTTTTITTSRPTLEPGKLNLRKTSVDDLRRLYEERVSTVQSLASAAEVNRRGSSLV